MRRGTDVRDEMLCARTRVGIAELGARRHVLLEGARVVEYLQQLLARNVFALEAGTALKSVWLSNGGGVRGAAAVARTGAEQFWLLSASRDEHWLHATAAIFGVAVRDVSDERTGFAVIGPYAASTLAAAGLQPAGLKPLAFRSHVWIDTEVVLSRFGEHAGFEIWCSPSDEAVVRDRMAEAGAPFGLASLSAQAMEGLDVEAGIPRPNKDYIPATENDAGEPSPPAWGLASLVEPDHAGFCGREAYMIASPKEMWRLAGVEIDSDMPAPHTPLLAAGRCIGRTLSSVYSPTLRRAIALARLDSATSPPGTRLALSLPGGLGDIQPRVVDAIVVDLPFLPPPEEIGS